MAAGKRPVPFRTRKLSPPAPMVLLPGGSGRVGYRRPNNFTQAPAAPTLMVRRVLCYAWPEPTWLDSALRTTPDTPTIGAYPRKSGVQLRIADNHTRTHHWRTPMKTPGRNHPAGRDLPMRGHRGRGASTRSHDDASCSAKVEYRTSSTPAYTDGLDLRYSTNNAPTTTQVRSTLRLADNTIYTNYWRTPTDSVPGPTPHCGQQEPAPSLVCTHELQIGAILRNADNPRYTHHWCTPTNISEWHPHKPTIHQGKHGATCTTSAIALR